MSNIYPQNLPGASWVKLIDETGASFANFTGVTGTWSSDGTVIKQTGTATSTKQRAKHATRVLGQHIIDVEFMIPTSGAIASQTDQRAGTMALWDGSSGTGGCLTFAKGVSNVGTSVSIEQDSIASRILNAKAFTYFDTWHKLRTYVCGNTAAAWLNGGAVVGSGNAVAANNDASFVGLYTFNTVTWFRNFRVWVPNVDPILAYPVIG